jgi:hypothetical protein
MFIFTGGCAASEQKVLFDSALLELEGTFFHATVLLEPKGLVGDNLGSLTVRLELSDTDEDCEDAIGWSEMLIFVFIFSFEVFKLILSLGFICFLNNL